MTEAERREYQRRYAQRKRDRKLYEKLRTAARCPKGRGGGICGGPLITRVGKFGATVVACEWCERKKSGMCRWCSRRPYAPRALYCVDHRKEAQRRQQRTSEARHHEERLARARAAYEDPEVRRRRNEYKRLYRKAHPEKVREWKRREVARQSKKYLDYHRRYNAQAKRAQRKREQATAAYYRQHPDRPDPHCRHCGNSIPWTPLSGGRAGSPPKNCDACCSKAELRRRLAVRARRAAAAECPSPAPVKPIVKPLRVKRPMPARYAETGQRLCFTPGCEIVVTHRKKKCTKCRQREIEEARQAIGAHQGRGRRTDLERVA